LPPLFVSLLNTFAPLFSDRAWRHAQVLLIGALLVPGQRTVTSCRRIVGLGRERRFVNYHRVLSRARWRGREASRLLLELLIKRFVPTGPIRAGHRRYGRGLWCKWESGVNGAFLALYWKGVLVLTRPERAARYLT
jgi:DDE superfamily endonuclease